MAIGMLKNMIQQIEQFVIETMATTASDLALAHNFDHVNRVRHWALRLAKADDLADLQMVETTALLHDVGLAHVTDRRDHADMGAEVAGAFLRNGRFFPQNTVDQICAAIAAHNKLTGGGILGALLRDADMLDLFGTTGIMRAFVSKHHKPEYDPANPKGETWGLNAAQFTKRFQTGQGIGPTIIDQLNFQMSCYDNLNSPTAKRLAEPQIMIMRNFTEQLAEEVA